MKKRMEKILIDIIKKCNMIRGDMNESMFYLELSGF